MKHLQQTKMGSTLKSEAVPLKLQRNGERGWRSELLLLTAIQQPLLLLETTSTEMMMMMMMIKKKNGEQWSVL